MALLSLYYAGLAGMVHAFALAGGEGIPAEDLATHLDAILSQFPSVAARTAGDIDAGQYAKDADVLAIHTSALAHLIQAAQSHDIDTDMLHAIKGLVDRTITAGHGDAEFAGVIEVMRD